MDRGHWRYVRFAHVVIATVNARRLVAIYGEPCPNRPAETPCQSITTTILPAGRAASNSANASPRSCERHHKENWPVSV
jgi:hypothetical protein